MFNRRFFFFLFFFKFPVFTVRGLFEVTENIHSIFKINSCFHTQKHIFANRFELIQLYRIAIETNTKSRCAIHAIHVAAHPALRAVAPVAEHPADPVDHVALVEDPADRVVPAAPAVHPKHLVLWRNVMAWKLIVVVPSVDHAINTLWVFCTL